MAQSSPAARLVLTTAANPDEARRLAHILVSEHLAACATLVPMVESIYHWEGKLESATETMLLLKTGAHLIEALEARLVALHSYQMPEFLVLTIEAASVPYLEWMGSNLLRGSSD